MRVGVSKMAHAGSVEKDVRPRAEVPVTSLSAALRGCDKLLQLPSRPAVPHPPPTLSQRPHPLVHGGDGGDLEALILQSRELPATPGLCSSLPFHRAHRFSPTQAGSPSWLWLRVPSTFSGTWGLWSSPSPAPPPPACQYRPALTATSSPPAASLALGLPFPGRLLEGTVTRSPSPCEGCRGVLQRMSPPCRWASHGPPPSSRR